MATKIFDKIFNTSIIRYDSEGFKVTPTFTPTLDLTDYTLKYYVKKYRNVEDEDALLTLSPILIEEESTQKININFLPTDYDNLPIGQYHHALKIISNDENTAITIFKGTLEVTQDYIKYPIEENNG